MQKIHEIILSFQAQKIINNIEQPFSQDEIDQLIHSELGRTNGDGKNSEATKPKKGNGLSIEGVEFALKDTLQDQTDMADRLFLIKKLE